MPLNSWLFNFSSIFERLNWFLPQALCWVKWYKDQHYNLTNRSHCWSKWQMNQLSAPSKARPTLFYWSEVKSLSRVQLFLTPWTIAYKAPLSMEFSRQEYWSGLPFPSPGDLPHPGIEPRSPALQADTLPSEPPGSPHYSTKYALI